MIPRVFSNLNGSVTFPSQVLKTSKDGDATSLVNLFEAYSVACNAACFLTFIVTTYIFIPDSPSFSLPNIDVICIAQNHEVKKA